MIGRGRTGILANRQRNINAALGDAACFLG